MCKAISLPTREFSLGAVLGVSDFEDLLTAVHDIGQKRGDDPLNKSL